jgi:hypothetical protein
MKVEHDAVWKTRRGRVDKFLTRMKDFNVHSRRNNQAPQRLANRLVVVDDGNQSTPFIRHSAPQTPFSSRAYRSEESHTAEHVLENTQLKAEHA